MYAFFTRDSFNRGYFGVTGIRLQKYVNVHTIVFRHGFDIALVRLRPLVWACSLELELSTIYPGPTWWAKQGSNLRPPVCKTGALTAELFARVDWNRVCGGRGDAAAGRRVVG